MKKTMKLFMAAFVMMATVSLVSCGKDEEETTYEASTSYAVRYEGRALKPGETVKHAVTEAERAADEAQVDFYIENITQEPLQTRFKVELIEGPDSMNELPVCYSQCKFVTCPYQSEVFTLAPGVDSQSLQIHCYISDHAAGSKGTYKITVGKSGSMEDPQIFFVQFVL